MQKLISEPSQPPPPPLPRACNRVCGSSNPSSEVKKNIKRIEGEPSKQSAIRLQKRSIINAHLAVGRAIVLEVALAAQHQFDVAHAAHAARLFAMDLADASLVADGVGMGWTMRFFRSDVRKRNDINRSSHDRLQYSGEY